MKRPVIGITVSQLDLSHAKSNMNPSAYASAIQNAGGLPLLIPNEYPLDQLELLRDICDGILISGGGDIDPEMYLAENHPKVSNVSKERDALEFALINLAVSIDWPILGICRGHQMMNVALGGTLFTHIPDQYETDIDHQTLKSLGHDRLAHKVLIKEDTKLASIVQSNSITVNSRHHQAINEPSSELMVTAKASDGLIEAIEHPRLGFFLGVQWHPENLQEHEEHRNIFSAFISAAKR